MAKYKVVHEFDGHKVGDVVELTEDKARSLGNKVEEIVEPA